MAISQYTENQLSAGVWDMWENKVKIPTLENKDELDEIYINQPDFELIEGMEWLNFKGNKVTKTTPWECKRSIVMGKPCVTIQEVDRDCILGAKVITNDIDLIIWLEDFKRAPRQRIVNINKQDIYDINNLERHGVRFNSTIDREELDQNGYMISNLDHYDNYIYEIYDSMRNTYQHQKRIDWIEQNDKTAMFLERWLENHEIKNDIEDLIEFWNKGFENQIKWNYSYQHKTPGDRNTYGYELYEGKMNELCSRYDIPITIGWDIWKIITREKMEKILKEIDRREKEMGI